MNTSVLKTDAKTIKIVLAQALQDLATVDGCGLPAAGEHLHRATENVQSVVRLLTALEGDTP